MKVSSDMSPRVCMLADELSVCSKRDFSKPYNTISSGGTIDAQGRAVGLNVA